MDGLEITVLLGVSVLLGTLLSNRLRIASPLVLVVLGLVLGFVPVLRGIELPPETVLLLFLPVMLFWEAMTTSLRALRREIRGVVLTSTLLVAATTFAVAGVAWALGLPWPMALILGAAVAPPDATAVAALGRSLPRRNFLMLKGESLTNDGTALVLYGIAVGIATGGTYSAWQITGMLLLSYLGGILAGGAVMALAYVVLRRVRSALYINVILLLTPFMAYLAAESIGASGVLAVVVAGLAASYVAPRISTAASRQQTEAVWPLGSFLLNGALFVLVGLEVQAVMHSEAFDAADYVRLGAMTVAVWLTLLLVRFAFLWASAMTIRALVRTPGQRKLRMSNRARVVSTVAGFRGAVSLAIALSIPELTGDGSPLAGRDDVIFVTAGVIVLTLLVQGPIMPAVVRWAQLPEDSDVEREMRIAERTITEVALARVEELAEEEGTSEEVLERLRGDYAEHLRLTEARSQDRVDREIEELDARIGPPEQEARELSAAEDGPRGEGVLAVETEEEVSPLRRNEEYTRLRLAILGAKREALTRLAREGTVDGDIVREIQTRLDIEEVRMRGPEQSE